MKKKNLRKTEGLPFTLGMAAGVVLLLETILSFNLNPIITQVTLDHMGMAGSSAALAGGTIGSMISTVVSFLIVPGIFLLLLILGKNKEKRGSAFAIVWLVISLLAVILGLWGLLFTNDKTLQTKIVEAVDLVMPGGYWIQTALSFIGNLLITASCIVFLKRLHEPPVDEIQSPENF
ncbi:MAG: hypothetical protein LKJ17_05755 [Oscillospiraceae bacterium]|nr:hypothetical protein [Oscillospiraceae bacterium]